jgi:hypothetical protein
MRVSDERGFLFLSRLAPRDRRAILLGLVVMLPAVIYFLGLKPYRAALEGIKDRVAAEREALERELDFLNSADSLSRELERAAARAGEHEGSLVQAVSGVLAEAELTDFLESAAFSSRVLLEEIRGGELGREEEPPAGLAVIRLHLRGESDLEGVLNFLDAIEKSRLLLRIRGLALEPEVSRSAPEDGQANQDREPIPTGVVDFQLIVDGFARVEEFGS